MATNPTKALGAIEQALRTKFFNGDYRRDPKTETYCAYCRKDIKPGSRSRMVHLINGGATVLHPGDEKLYASDGGDLGLHLIGYNCAKKLGLEWSHP